MRKDLLYVVMQPEAKNSFWAQLIHGGIREEARFFHDTLCAVDPGDLSYDLKGQYTLVVGNHAGWIESSVIALLRRGALPIIVNASVLPIKGLRCSGVTFELEEIIGRCVDLFAAAGRRRVALLGVNPNSLTDCVKADFFTKASVNLQPGDIYWASNSLEACVTQFAEQLTRSDHNAVLCSNDTVAIRLLGRLPAGTVPKRLYVVGMGNSYLGANLSGGLTSVRFDYREMGKMSVQLYHDLVRMRTKGHLMLSLPCYLIVRHTAPLRDRPFEPKATAAEPPLDNYFAGAEVQNVIRVETMLQSGDAFDREIIFGIKRGETCEQIAERLFFSGRAVRYRLSNIIKRYGFQNRTELENAVCAALGGKEE